MFASAEIKSSGFVILFLYLSQMHLNAKFIQEMLWSKIGACIVYSVYRQGLELDGKGVKS
jgi:hypothetical protein